MRQIPIERTPAAIGRRLLATRVALGMTQRELCRQAKIEPNTYNQWEKGRQRPMLDEAVKLVDKFELTLDWIYLGDNRRLPYDLAHAIICQNPPTADPP